MTKRRDAVLFFLFGALLVCGGAALGDGLSVPVAPPAAVAPSAPPLPTIVQLRTSDGGYGSGVVVAPGWVLTAAHCATAATANGLEVQRVYIAPGGSVDMALMWVPGIEGVPVRLAGSLPVFGDELRAIGWHLGDSLLMTAGFAGVEPGAMSAQIIHGCSGGPVINAAGELVGVIEAVRWGETPAGDHYVLSWIAWYTPADAAIRSWIAATTR